MIASEVREMLSFIDGNPTAYHTTASVREILLKAGFSELLESGKQKGRLTTKEISDALHEQFALTIEKQKIVQAEPIKSFGAYEVKCKLGYEVTGTIHVLVIEEK